MVLPEFREGPSPLPEIGSLYKITSDIKNPSPENIRAGKWHLVVSTGELTPEQSTKICLPHESYVLYVSSSNGLYLIFGYQPSVTRLSRHQTVRHLGQTSLLGIKPVSFWKHVDPTPVYTIHEALLLPEHQFNYGQGTIIPYPLHDLWRNLIRKPPIFPLLNK